MCFVFFLKQAANSDVIIFCLLSAIERRMQRFFRLWTLCRKSTLCIKQQVCHYTWFVRWCSMSSECRMCVEQWYVHLRVWICWEPWWQRVHCSYTASRHGHSWVCRLVGAIRCACRCVDALAWFAVRFFQLFQLLNIIVLNRQRKPTLNNVVLFYVFQS